METPIVYDSALTPADHIVLRNLANDIKTPKSNGSLKVADDGHGSTGQSSSTDGQAYSRTPSPLKGSSPHETISGNDTEDIAKLRAMRDPAHADYVPTLFLSVDGWPAGLPPSINKLVLQPYVRWARRIVRHETDVVMLTHLIVYFTTTVPSALLLYRHFTYLHGVLHLIMQGYYMGTYTLMMHQHIHQRGILAKKYSLFDGLFPYLTDPLMGHTWNGYYYHHVKHHHVEGNGPSDLSSTVRYQRDSFVDFLQYLGRFYFLIWFDLPLYFLRKSRPGMAAQAAVSELGTYAFYFAMARFNLRPTLFVYLLPLLFMRLGLMVGNWGQHALVDADEPDSDYRSSITLVDVPVNRGISATRATTNMVTEQPILLQ